MNSQSPVPSCSETKHTTPSLTSLQRGNEIAMAANTVGFQAQHQFPPNQYYNNFQAGMGPNYHMPGGGNYISPPSGNISGNCGSFDSLSARNQMTAQLGQSNMPGGIYPSGSAFDFNFSGGVSSP